jgi:hypothetical protein
MTFCQDVDDCTWNIHPLFGQIYFVKGLHKHDTSILPNYPCTTVCGLNQKFKSFENFLLERNYRTTVSENKHKRKIALTVDNLLSDQIKASEIICLFEKLVVEEETR